jgi:hypothetical protein
MFSNTKLQILFHGENILLLYNINLHLFNIYLTELSLRYYLVLAWTPLFEVHLVYFLSLAPVGCVF